MKCRNCGHKVQEFEKMWYHRTGISTPLRISRRHVKGNKMFICPYPVIDRRKGE